MTNPAYADRLALALCAANSDIGPCSNPCEDCRRDSAAVATELAAILRERQGKSSATADWLDSIPALPPPAPAGKEPGIGDPAPVPSVADLALRVERLEAMRETEKAALLDAFRQIDELKQRLDFQYWKLYKLEESITPDAD